MKPLELLKARTLLALLMPLVLLFGCAAEPEAVVTAKPLSIAKDVPLAEAEKLMEEPEVVVLDLRTERELSGGRLPGARHIDFNAADFDQQLSTLDREKSYLIYCAVGGRSAKALTKMSQMGFTAVYNMEGGFRAWESAGKPVDK